MDSSYRELAPRGELTDLLACGWSQTVGGSGHAQRVLPDGCVDVVLLDGSLLVAGPATRAQVVALAPSSEVVGVRFRPGAAAALLGLPLSELRDRDVPLAELWGRDAAERLEEELAGASVSAGAGAGAVAGAVGRVRVLERALLARRRDAPGPDATVAAAARVVAAGPGELRVGALGDALGVSERQLRRRFRAAVGYGPKTLARVLRFQRFATAGWSAGADVSLARLAADVGYADQAHLARDCRELAGVAPSVLLRGG